MASCCNFAKPAAGSNVGRQMHNRLRCVVILLLMAIMMKGACAKTVLYNKSGRHLALIVPHSMRTEMPVGQSVELVGAHQQRGVIIQNVESGDISGPFDLPDGRFFEVMWLDPSTAASAVSFGSYTNAKGNACIGNIIQAGVNKGGKCP